MRSCKECESLYPKPLPPQRNCNDCFDIVNCRIKDLEAKLKIAVEALEFGYNIVSSDYVTIANLDMMEIVFKDKLEKIEVR